MSGQLPFHLSAAALILASNGTWAQETDPFAPLMLETRPLATRWQSDYAGAMQLGLGFTNDDNYTFGQYTGLQDDGATLIGNLRWQDFRSGEEYWQVSMSDLGLDTREGHLTWGRTDRLRVQLGFDSQQQVRNDSGRTPFSGEDKQTLPGNWVSGQNTTDFANLNASLRGFDRELDRDKLSMAFDARLNDNWRLDSNLSYEEKEGNGDVGTGIYINGAAADAVLLRSPIDYSTTEFDLGLAYDEGQLHLNGQLAYSIFDNDDDVLTWQNPYSSYGSRVRYPDGVGGLGLAPDNEQLSGRLVGHYIFSPTTRLQFDGSYAVASQDQSYSNYSVNDSLVVTVPLPENDLDGEVATGTLNTRLLFRPLDRLNAELFYKLRDRDYDVSRNGYLYIRGDGGDQPGSPQTVYNTAHDLTSQTAGFEANYPLPLRSKLSFGYEYKKEERENAAVEETEEDRFKLGYRIRPWTNFSARLQLQYADRAADDYEWDQSYLALLDTQLINATPDSQRYTNHPQLFQYYMANRERWESKADLSYLPTDQWNLNLNLSWRDDDYDQSNLGLTESTWGRLHLSSSYAVSTSLTASAYAGYDHYEADQSSRAFRGGQEKNAFAVYPPLPQASDPRQNWDIDATDTSITLGASVQWQVAEDVEVNLNYNFVDTDSEQDYSTRPGSSVIASDLPDVDTRLHQLEATGTWHMQDNLSLQLDYQFYTYKTDDWAWDNVQADTMDKVLSFGQSNPNEDIHYLGASVIYRWQ